MDLDPAIIALGLAASMITKIGVSLLRMALADVRCRAWLSVVVALLIGEASSFLLILAAGAALTTQTSAQAFIAGILATSVAVGATELQKKAVG